MCSTTLLLIAAAIGMIVGEKAPPVQVQQGLLRGRIRHVRGSAKQMMACSGIPYAKPPLGPLRFKNPVAAEGWSGERQCTKECSECTQPLNPAGGKNIFVKGKENCLCLNVYSPYPLPAAASVMVWIHGGAFVSGDGGELIYGPDFLVNEGVVVVTLNYRLGALGFLDLDHPEAPGNQGLKDQLMALRWVRDNINAFGGDPNNVTIFGESAGSASVHFHTLSPMSRGLFGAAIMQSGSALNPWAWKKSTRANAEQLLQAVGCDAALVQDAAAATDCLRRVPANKLSGSTTAYLSQEDEEHWQDISFPPTLDEQFLPEEPCRLVAEGRTALVPTMAGFNSDEGILGIAMMRFRGGVEATAEALANGKGLCFPCDACPESSAVLKQWATTVGGRYFNGKPFEDSTMQGFVDYTTYYMFFHGIIMAALLRANSSTTPTYFYEFDVDTPLNFAKVLFGGEDLKGASHADELSYIFHNKLVGVNVTENSVEEQTRRLLVKSWTHFAKTGNPTPLNSGIMSFSWEQFNVIDEPYLYFGNQGVEMKQHPLKEEREFFQKLRNKM